MFGNSGKEVKLIQPVQFNIVILNSSGNEIKSGQFPQNNLSIFGKSGNKAKFSSRKKAL